MTAPEVARLDGEEQRLTGRLAGLRRQGAEHERWVDQHSEAARRIEQLGMDIDALDERLQRSRSAPARAVGLDQHGPRRGAVQERDFGIDL